MDFSVFDFVLPKVQDPKGIHCMGEIVSSDNKWKNKKRPSSERSYVLSPTQFTEQSMIVSFDLWLERQHTQSAIRPCLSEQALAHILGLGFTNSYIIISGKSDVT